MFFNSPEFVAFFLFVLAAFAVANRKRTLPLRNLVLLLASYWFYAQLHAWFVALLVYTTLVNYLCGLWLARCQQQGRRGQAVVTVAILLSLAQLALFKYAYLAVPSVILPVGLSFFTFQALTYTIDIYRRKIPVERNLLNVALFVSFFPTLLSGPIERARNLLPLIHHIYGSPPTKDVLLAALLAENRLVPEETVFFGDAPTDCEAARINKIPFIGICPGKKNSPFPPHTTVVSAIDLDI